MEELVLVRFEKESKRIITKTTVFPLRLSTCDWAFHASVYTEQLGPFWFLLVIHLLWLQASLIVSPFTAACLCPPLLQDDERRPVISKQLMLSLSLSLPLPLSFF